MRKDTAGNLCW